MCVPANKDLYEKIKRETKKKFSVWPSAYASGYLTREYKKRGGRYIKCSKKSEKSPRKKSQRKKTEKSGLDRWYSEKWVDVCKYPKIVPCGRKKASPNNYPYCRPLIRINRGTPKTVKELSKSEREKRCALKRRSPYKRLYEKS